MGNERGAKSTTNLFSLIEMAKTHALNPFDYLRYVFEKLPLTKTVEDYEALMPYKPKAIDISVTRESLSTHLESFGKKFFRYVE